MIKVVIADDHHLVRQGIRSLLEQTGAIQVLGEAADGQEALDLTEKLQPDVLILDIGMPRLSGLQVLEQLRLRHLPVRAVMLSMHTDQGMVKHALQAGAKGYVLKSSLLDEVMLAIRAAHRGHTYISPEITQGLVTALFSDESGLNTLTAFEQLSPREAEVLKLLAEGHSNQSIAEMLLISLRTVQKHRANLMTKLDVHDLAGLTKVAIQHHLIFLEG